jgi:chemotaxis signal transduction protein
MNRDIKEAKLLCFSTKNYRWFARLSDETALETSIKTYPLFKLPQWCLGMVVVGGEVSTVIDLEGLFDSNTNQLASDKPLTPNKSILLIKNNYKIALSIQSLLGLQNTSSFQAYKTNTQIHNPLLSQPFKNDDGDIYYHFDTSVFMPMFEKVCQTYLSREITKNVRDKSPHHDINTYQ